MAKAHCDNLLLARWRSPTNLNDGKCKLDTLQSVVKVRA